MREEMGVAVVVGEELARVRHSYPDLSIELLAFRCEMTKGEPADIVCDTHAWVKPGSLVDYDLLPPDRELAGMVFENHGRRPGA